MADMNIVDVLNLSRETLQIKRKTGTKIFAFCPHCGKPKLCINTEKNVFRCPVCDYSGSAIDLWADLNNIPGQGKERQRQAGIDYNKVVSGEKKTIRKPVVLPSKVKEFDRADPATVHKTLCTFLHKLSLNESHMENLLKRGLAEEIIRINGYKSAPLTATSNICHELMNEGCTLEGVPGFYQHKGSWQFVKYGDGFFIPSRDEEGQIHDLQIRLIHPREDQPRYLTVSSSGKESGCSGSTMPHVNYGNVRRNTIILTEGPLKADIISHITGFTTIAVLGVNSLSTLNKTLKFMRDNGYKQVHIAYDMDMYANENVYKAYIKLKGLIQSAGLSFDTLEWDPENKGLDDHLVNS